MNRRSFLRRFGVGLAGTAAAVTLDPERALWVPGQKTFFIPERVKVANLRDVLKTGDVFTIEGDDRQFVVTDEAIYEGDGRIRFEDGMRADVIGGGNRLVSTDLIVQEAVRIFNKNLHATKRIHRKYEMLRALDEATVSIRLPQRFA